MQYIIYRERFEPMSNLKSRLSLIVQVNVVLKRTFIFTLKMTTAQVVETSTTTVLFRTTFTRTIKLNLLVKISTIK